jgi:hypothetical protein
VRRVAALEYLVPKPFDQTYALIKGEVACATTMPVPLFEKFTVEEEFGIAGLGSAYLVPKPEDDHV